MLKKIMRMMLVLGVMILITSINVFAETNTLMHYEPYSSWASDIANKYELVFSEKPQREILRWEVVNIFSDLSSKVESYTGDNKVIFSDLNDIPENVTSKIQKSASMGLISGYGDNTFKPFNNITRAEFVAIMKRFGFMDNIKEERDILFHDTENHWAISYITEAASKNIVNGKSDKMFLPDDSITIEEVLIIFDRFVECGEINKKDLIDTFLNTFYLNANVIDKDDLYMANVIYKEMDNINQEMKLYANTLIGYDYTDIGTRLTLEDVLLWRSYYDSYSIYEGLEKHIDLNNEESKTFLFTLDNRYFESGEEKHFFMQNGTFDYGRPVTLLEFLEPYSRRNFYMLRKEFEPANVNFSNINEFSDSEREIISKAVGVGLLPNSNYAFPGKQYMTKAMLNYITVKANKINNLYKRSFYYVDHEAYVDENSATWPSNHYLYPYIYRPLDNEAYEVPFMNSDNANSKCPYDIFGETKHCYNTLQNKVKKFCENIFNVNYETIDEQTMYDNIESCYYHRFHKEYLREYVKYVKDNKIVLKGTYKNCLPILYYDGASNVYRIRVKINLEIVNSETRENLLFGDLVKKPECPTFENYYHTNMVYEDNNYEFYFDIPLVRYSVDETLLLALPFRINDNISLCKQGKISVVKEYFD